MKIKRGRKGPITRTEVHEIGTLLETAHHMGGKVEIDAGYLAELLLTAASQMEKEQ